MLRLEPEQHLEAVARLAEGFAKAEEMGLVTMSGRLALALEALGEDFDIEPIDPGPDPGLELGHDMTPLEKDLLRSLDTRLGVGVGNVVAFPSRWT